MSSQPEKRFRRKFGVEDELSRYVSALYEMLGGVLGADKIVLVGGTAVGIGDIRTIPYQAQDEPYMGVEVHANIIDNLLHSAEPHRTFLVRGARELRKHENSRIFRILGGDIFLRHQIHAVAQRRDETDVG